MATFPENSLTVVVRAWIFMLIFCLMGCAAGSCLSYGHSCWGAHGKRSGGHASSSVHLVPSKTMANDMQQDAPPYTKEQWILSRLIAGRPLPMSTKYRARWNNLSKLKPFVPQRWNYDELSTYNIPENFLRSQGMKDDVDVDNGRKVNDIEDMAQGIIDEREESPDVLLISRNEQSVRDSNPQNIDLIKILNKANDNFE